MSLSRHLSPETVLSQLQQTMPKQAVKFRDPRHKELSKYAVDPIPKFHIAQDGMNSDAAYNIIRNDLDLDGRPNLNLAGFINTYIDQGALKLATENLTKNLADNDEYPALLSLHQRCVSIIGHLWNVPNGHVAVGTATTGSSEAIHLGGLAMKRRWEARQKRNGRAIDKPNILMGANAQVALEKFARYFDVEARIIPVSEKSRYCLDLSKVKENLDENTIGIFVILGSTYTGHYEDVKGVSDILDEFEKESGFDIPIHVDGASGAFIAPFLHPNVEWDFRLNRVKSINVSGHKYGLTTAGLGWIIWKDKKYLPDNLVFILKYLGGSEASYTLNFSRPGFQVIHQYYNLITLGAKGYRRLHGASLANARLFSNFLEATGYFQVASDIHRKKGVLGYQGLVDPEKVSTEEDHEYYNPGLPVVSFRFTSEFVKDYPEIPQSTIATMLKTKGYILPNYPLPPDQGDKEVLRVVIRTTMSVELLDRLMSDIVVAVQQLMDAAEHHREHRKPGTDASESSLAAYQMLNVLAESKSALDEHEELWDGNLKKADKHHAIC